MYSVRKLINSIKNLLQLPAPSSSPPSPGVEYRASSIQHPVSSIEPTATRNQPAGLLSHKNLIDGLSGKIFKKPLTTNHGGWYRPPQSYLRSSESYMSIFTFYGKNFYSCKHPPAAEKTRKLYRFFSCFRYFAPW